MKSGEKGKVQSHRGRQSRGTVTNVEVPWPKVFHGKAELGEPSSLTTPIPTRYSRGSSLTPFVIITADTRSDISYTRKYMRLRLSTVRTSRMQGEREDAFGCKTLRELYREQHICLLAEGISFIKC